MLKIECKLNTKKIPQAVSWDELEEGPVYKIVSVLEDARRFVKIRCRVFLVAIDSIYDITEMQDWKKERFQLSPETVTLTFCS
jgi:hypothetical protein